MKKTLINALIATAFLASLSLASTGAMAGRDFFQEQLIQNLQVTNRN